MELKRRSARQVKQLLWKHGRLRQYDVAQRAGVSESVVSRVLLRDKRVADETRERVWQAIGELLGEAA